MAIIQLTQGKSTIVDDDLFEELSQRSWYWCPNARGGYAAANRSRKVKPHTMYMHRIIMGANDDEDVDHINGDGLDNRRANLRRCTRGQNHANRRPVGGTSQYKGVCWATRPQRWIATIKTNRRTRYLGSFHNETQAALAYDAAAIELFGEFARINFPNVMNSNQETPQ